ncbi:DRAP deaminase [Coccidioides immitis RS]|uniref:DRAP deaminase n=1 Tax=Coccidioides immitis (strain RS) TaxID=246410 RepID=J3KEV3_COCIM|nr:DRAP deaminase [Coccidioides immitis RS]EAS34061.3 DRAP deaminase [Coccidioides immitis RS]
MAALQPYHTTELSTHLHYLTQCLALAAYSPPKPTNFRVGAILLLRRYFPPTLGTTPDQQTTFEDKILSTGYTLEHRGNTHAEQCCLSKYASHHGVPEEDVGIPLQKERGDNPNAKILMYVTMEPCGKRLSGNKPCAARIVEARNHGRAGIDRVYFGVKEPGTFVGQSQGCKMLDAAGIGWELVEGMEDEILKVAKAGHGPREGETNVDDISIEEQKRQKEMPRNPKKRMMEI